MLQSIQSHYDHLPASSASHIWMDIATTMWTLPTTPYSGGTFIDYKVPGSVVTLKKQGDLSQKMTTQTVGWIVIGMLHTCLVGAAFGEDQKIWPVPAWEVYWTARSRQEFAWFRTQTQAPATNIKNEMVALETADHLDAANNNRWRGVSFEFRSFGQAVGTRSFLYLAYNALAGEIWQTFYSEAISRRHATGTGINFGPTPAGVNLYIQFLALQDGDYQTTNYWFAEALTSLILQPQLKDDPKAFEADVYLVDAHRQRAERPFLRISLTGRGQALGSVWSGVPLTKVAPVNGTNEAVLSESAAGIANLASEMGPVVTK